MSSGGSVALTWSSANSENCTASGDWQGSKETQGEESVGPLSVRSSFTLTCAGTDGTSVVAMVSVDVMGQMSLSWDPPTLNTDGSSLDNLASYEIHYGDSSGDYDNVVQIDAGGNTHTLELPVGAYYVALRAVNGNGQASALSNEQVLSSR